METETLTNYNSSAEMHLFEENTNKAHLKNGLREPNNFDKTEEQDNDGKFIENNSTEKVTKDEDLNNCHVENHSKEMFDSDLEEEEEHVPLNIEINSDIEKSDDDLDDTNEEPNTYESDKEECSKITDELIMDIVDPLDTTDCNNSKIDDESRENLSDKNKTERGNTNNYSNIAENIEKDQPKHDDIPSNHNTTNLENAKDDKISETNHQKQSSEKDCELVENELTPMEHEKEKIFNEKKENENKPESKEIDTNEIKNEREKCEEKLEKETEKKEEKSDNKSDEAVTKDLKDTVEQTTVNKEAIDNSEETRKEKDNSDKMMKETELKSKLQENPSCPLLMETLTRKNDKETANDDEDMDEAYFDPSLLCPDISMEVDEDPVITTNDAPPPARDGNKSPQLYEPMFSTFVDEMTGAEVSLNLSMEEETLRREMYGEHCPVQLTKIHCTACNVHLGSALDGQGNRFVHPLLKVLICKNCYHFYTSGEFEKDEDGSELYCRWCGQGGQVMCCSNCEMVFCKKCIRINFDRKKLAEIRDSDDWTCFRCNPSQLTYQRIHCAEFMEYVRREISRAATLDNATTFMTTDYTQCCPSQKKKATESPAGEPKKKKRKIPSEDPDYDPLKDREESASPQPSTSGYPSGPPKPSTTPKPPNIVSVLPAHVQASLNVNTNNTPTKTVTTQFKPRIHVVSSPAPNTGQRPKVSGPGYIKILPGGIRVPGNTPTPRATYTNRQMIPPLTQAPSTPIIQIQPRHQQPNVQQKQTPVRGMPTGSPTMKHEWFEKTVRAAARVNSNLSYTLTQLNRAQSNAQSVEALAVVHNKLQEILSTSINSLIQIRKNLRTEFIAGIKNIRFPPAAAKPAGTPVVPIQKPPASTDDDVIFISPPTSPVPPPLTPKSTLPPQFSHVNLPASLSIIRKPNPNTSTESTVKSNQSASKPNQTNANSTASAATINKPPEMSNDRPKTFLRVKSLTALQNVPSECITIPDDPLPPPPPLTPIRNDDIIPPRMEINDVNTDVVEIIDDNRTNEMVDGTKNTPPNGGECLTFNLNESYLHAVKNLRVVIPRSTELEELLKNNLNLVSCDISD